MKTLDLPHVCVTTRGRIFSRRESEQLVSLAMHYRSYSISHWRPLWSWLIRTPRQTIGWKFTEPRAWCREVQLANIFHKQKLSKLGLNFQGFTGIVSADFQHESSIVLEYDRGWDEWSYVENARTVIPNYFPEFLWDIDSNMEMWADTLRTSIHIIEDAAGLEKSVIYPVKIKDNGLDYEKSTKDKIYYGIVCDIKDETWWSNTGWISFYMLLYRLAPFHKYFMQGIEDLDSLQSALDQSQRRIRPPKSKKEYKINDRHYHSKMPGYVIRGLVVSKKENFISQIMEGKQHSFWNTNGIRDTEHQLHSILRYHEERDCLTFTKNQANYILYGE